MGNASAKHSNTVFEVNDHPHRALERGKVDHLHYRRGLLRREVPVGHIITPESFPISVNGPGAQVTRFWVTLDTQMHDQ
jgi:hypothetical protein